MHYLHSLHFNIQTTDTMNTDNLKPVLDQFLNGKAGEFNIKHIPLTDSMIERLEVFADELDISVQECASFLLWSYLLDVEHKANAIKENIMPRN